MTSRRETQMGDQVIFISYPLKHQIRTGVPIAPDYTEFNENIPYWDRVFLNNFVRKIRQYTSPPWLKIKL